MKKYLLIAFLILGSITAFSQNRNILKVVSENDHLNKGPKKIFSYKKEHPDSLSAILELKNLVLRSREQSYLLTSVDSIYKRGDTLFAVLIIGPSWQWSHLRQGNVSDHILNKTNYKEKFYSFKPFKFSETVKLEKEILDYSENHGYPFATITLDSIQIENSNQVDASLDYQSGPYIVFDSIALYGKTKIKKKFLMRYLRILPGQPYSQEKVKNIDKLLKQIPYLKQTRPLAITFNKSKAIINLFVEDRRSNQVDGIVGLLPNESSKSKVLLTGELNLNLKNLFGTGKNLAAEWKKYNQASQILNLSYYHPRILTSNLDVKIDFNLLKQDSSFINISRHITISQSANKYGRVNFYGGLKTSRELISSKITDKSSLPPFSNYDYYNYGLGYDWNNLDDFFYPHKGWFVSAQGIIGNKTIHKSSGYADSLYRSTQLKSVQLNMNLTVERFFRIGKKSVLVSRLDGGNIFNNKGSLFYNDLYRIGGLKTLRGFNENNFYASSYGIGTIEYRFFTDQTSYLLMFFNQGYIKNTLNTTLPTDYPYGFGAGISFSTNVGIFNFIYSLGNSKSQPLNFNLSKIHFGLVSRF